MTRLALDSSRSKKTSIFQPLWTTMRVISSFKMRLNIVVILILQLIFVIINDISGARLTPLVLDNYPCKPENLLSSYRYICDSSGEVICLPGWDKPKVQRHLDKLHPCLRPICPGGCGQGTCRLPYFCSCDVGWHGLRCDKCVPKPGCSNGACTLPFECNCDPGWTGPFCSEAECDGCLNGICYKPNECLCEPGWTGIHCDQCIPREGCLHGTCHGNPDTCDCDQGWEGIKCDQPVCNPPCVHGQCTEPSDLSHRLQENSRENYCYCEKGWRGSTCADCSPYWNCPNQGMDACKKPNECFCFKSERDPHSLCNNTELGDHRHFWNSNLVVEEKDNTS